MRWKQSTQNFISIHALCEEGDRSTRSPRRSHGNFYPRPLRGGRRIRHDHTYQQGLISIHALCEEGDALPALLLSAGKISIHALCEEGDPRPRIVLAHESLISIHALCEEGDHDVAFVGESNFISIHALCEEGDWASTPSQKNPKKFLSTPSARRATRLRSL